MKTKIIIILLLIFLCASCEKLVDHGYFFRVQNNSNLTLQCFISYNYPDTSMSINKPLMHTLIPQTFTTFESEKDWKDVLTKDTIIIYILNKDTVNFYNWDIIISKYKILKRYDISIKELENMNWKVTYP